MMLKYSRGVSNRRLTCASSMNIEKTPIFQLSPHIRVDLEDVRRIYELQMTISLRKSNMLYESMAINGPMVDKYLVIVEDLEKKYNKSPSLLFPSSSFPNSSFPNSSFLSLLFPSSWFLSSLFLSSSFLRSSFLRSSFPNSSFLSSLFLTLIMIKIALISRILLYFI